MKSASNSLSRNKSDYGEYSSDLETISNKSNLESINNKSNSDSDFLHKKLGVFCKLSQLEVEWHKVPFQLIYTNYQIQKIHAALMLSISMDPD